MKDKYTGDVGDFGKYGMLNELCKQSNFSIRLGVNWYYTTNDEKNRDGGHIEYLDTNNKNSKEFRNCLPDLYDNLQTIVENGRRKINEIEKSRILPDNTIFYSNPLPLKNIHDKRELWFKKSLKELENADIIFLDPDTGILVDSTKQKQINFIKYAFTNEIKEYYEKGKSLIIYNHRDHSKKSEYDKKIFGIRDYINPNGILVLRFKKRSVRDYIFLVQKKHQDLITETIKVLVSKPYDFLFRYYDLKLQQAFQKVFGFPIPFSIQDLQPIEGKTFLLGSPIALKKQFLLQGCINEFLESCPEGYFLLGFWGHGLMSDGFYYSRVDSWSKIFFRLPYTGAYYTIEEGKEMVRCVREFLTQFVEFENKISTRAKSLIAVESMGEGYYKVVMLNGKTYEIKMSLFADCNLLTRLSDLCEI